MGEQKMPGDATTQWKRGRAGIGEIDIKTRTKETGKRMVVGRNTRETRARLLNTST